MSSAVAPPPPKPVDVLTKAAPAAFERAQAMTLLFVREFGGLEDDLDEHGLGGVDDGADVHLDEGVVVVLHGADVEHHVDLAGAAADGLARLEGLGVGGHGAEREAHHGADRHAAALEELRHHAHVGRVHADAGEPVLAGFLGELEELLAGGLGLEQRMVDVPREAGLGLPVPGPAAMRAAPSSTRALASHGRRTTHMPHELQPVGSSWQGVSRSCACVMPAVFTGARPAGGNTGNCSRV
jgi:hypothetical protein